MDFQNLADSFQTPACVISVKRTPDGGYGEIRLVAGNAKYIEPIEHPVFIDIPDMPGIPEIFKSVNKFVPDSPYERYLPKDMGFEDVCYRAAVKKIPIHTYVHMNDIEIWFDIFCLPLDIEDGDVCYCIYAAQPADSSDVGISSSQSGTASEDVIKTCIKLHSTDDFRKTMEDVIKDIRMICRAEVCTIILADTAAETYSVLATSIDEKCNVKQVTQFSNFGNITASWLDMFGGNDCLIIRNENDMAHIRNVNHAWYETLEEARVKSLVLFPLKYDNEVLGFVWATNFDTANTMRIKETLELTTFFISSKLSSYKMLEHLKDISYTDQLTGIPNRFAFTDHMEELIKHGEPFAVVSIDINGFKSINDTMGFDTGNKVLSEIAVRWKKIADEGLSGTTDYIARMGGDEYSLIVRGYSSEEDILKTVKRYETELNSCLTIDGCDLFITASFGYCVFPEDADTCDSLCS